MKNQAELKNKMVLLRQIARYLVVGGLSTAFNYFIFYMLLTFWEVNYLIASATGFILSVLLGYVFNRKWTFGDTDPSNAILIRYFTVYLISLLLSMLLLKIAVQWLLLPAEWANILAIGFTTCTNFLGLKYLVFKRQGSR